MTHSRNSFAAAAALAILAAPATAQTYNLYGTPGLIDMPSAEMMPDAQLGATFSLFDDTSRTNVGFQILPRIHGTLRVGTITDQPDGSETSFQGFDLRFQLLEEDGMLPAVALGFRDFLGDGPYGAEYLVATKTVADSIKLTGGVGFGRLGGVGGVSNPFGLDDRPGPTDPAGRLQTGRYFHGDAGFFGGVEWATPIDGLTLKAEYSSDAYEAEEAGGFDRKSPFNFGLTYEATENLLASAYYMYGSTVGAQLTFTGNPRKPLAPQDLGSGPAPVRTRADDAPRGTGWANMPQNRDKLISALADALEPDGIVIEEARITGTEVDLYISNTRMHRDPKAIGRVARILSLAMPPSVETFRITLMSGDLAVTTAEIARSDMEAQVDRPGAGLSSWQTTRLTDARASLEGPGTWQRPRESRFSWAIGPSLPLNLLDTNDGFRPDLLINGVASYRIARGLSVTGEVSRFLVGTDQKTESTSDSTLPHVRSDSDLYYSGRDVDLDRLTADWVFQPAPAVYGRVSAGILERMFTGVSGEVLYAPVNSDIAVGGELNYVKQRDIDDPFALQDYDVVTGHASLYWDTGYNGLEAQLDAGRYLAGDWGATVSLSRRFRNGWDVRGYVTRTDVSVDDFGDGSYAKGFQITIPLGWSLPFETRYDSTISLLPTESDGGARLDVRGRLYERIRDLDRRSLEDGWSAFWQ